MIIKEGRQLLKLPPLFFTLEKFLCLGLNIDTEVFIISSSIESRLNFLTNQNIKTAKFAGFCYGVKRAVDTVIKLKQDNPDKSVYILGELIHNAFVISELQKLGIITLSSIKELPKEAGGYCVIRSHGAAPEIFEKLQSTNLEVVDLTCPDVKKVQQKAVELAKSGYYVIIVGKAEHPEVEAIYANARKWSEFVKVINSKEQVQSIKNDLVSHKKIGIVVQTTQRVTTLNEIISELTVFAKELLIYNTICQSTSMRQQEAIELSKDCDLMIVAGSKNSANTTHLAEILKNKTRTLHIENVEELKEYNNILKVSKNIGITAGASTPQEIIDNVIKYIKEE